MRRPACRRPQPTRRPGDRSLQGSPNEMKLFENDYYCNWFAQSSVWPSNFGPLLQLGIASHDGHPHVCPNEPKASVETGLSRSKQNVWGFGIRVLRVQAALRFGLAALRPSGGRSPSMVIDSEGRFRWTDQSTVDCFEKQLAASIATNWFCLYDLPESCTSAHECLECLI